jgi:hypothetical protein
MLPTLRPGRLRGWAGRFHLYLRGLAAGGMLLLVFFALAAGGARAAGGGLIASATPIPPGNPAENQYVEDFPGSAGATSLNSLIQSRQHRFKLSPSLRRALRRSFGRQARGPAAFLAATSSAESAAGATAVGLPGGTAPALAAASSVFGAGGALGVLLPIILGALALALAGLAVARRRRHLDSR